MKTPSFTGTGRATSISRSSAGVFVLAARGALAGAAGLHHLEPGEELVVLEQLEDAGEPIGGGGIAVPVEAEIEGLAVAPRDEARRRERVLVEPQLRAGEVVGLSTEEDGYLIAEPVETDGGGEVGPGRFRGAAQHLLRVGDGKRAVG